MNKMQNVRHGLALHGKRPATVEPVTEIIYDAAKWASERELAAIYTLLDVWRARDMERVERIVSNNTFRSLRSRAVVIVKRGGT
jgi:hypothetical protein